MLAEGLYRSERATAEAATYPERTVEDNTQARMALQIAAEAPMVCPLRSWSWRARSALP
jgi:hypothetical protein